MKVDADIASASDGSICCVSVDMQKVIQIPKLTIKDAFFSRKLNVFNETFAPIDSKGKSVCVLWHEGQSGRKASNIATAYIEFIINCARDAEKSFFTPTTVMRKTKTRSCSRHLFAW